MTRQARYGGAEADTKPSATATTNRHFSDNACVEDMSVEAAMALGLDWWQAGIAGCLRHIITLCERQIKRHEGRMSGAELEAYWLPFADFCELCVCTKDISTTVNYMGEMLTNFPHAYGETAASTRFFQHILPRATEAARLTGIKLTGIKLTGIKLPGLKIAA